MVKARFSVKKECVKDYQKAMEEGQTIRIGMLDCLIVLMTVLPQDNKYMTLDLNVNVISGTITVG